MLKYLLAAVLMVISQHNLASTCKSLVEHQVANQLNTSTLFNHSKATVVVFLCAQEPLPVYYMFHTKLMSDVQLENSITPMTTFVNVKLPINPNGKTKATGFLAVNRDEDDSFTLRLRVRLATGEAIDIGKKVVLQAGESILFEDSKIHVGIALLGQR